MIVNPKLFRNRLISSSIIVTIAVLTVYGFYSFFNLNVEQSQLVQENDLLENELSVMIDKYDEVQDTNQNLQKEVQIVKDSIESTVLVVESLRSELSLLPTYKRKLASYTKENEALSTQKDSLSQITNNLLDEKSKVVDRLDDQKKENEKLLKETNKLKKAVGDNIIVVPNSIKASAMSASFLGKKEVTKRASRARILEVNFSLSKNINVDPGKKVFYIQVIGPDRNVMSDKGAVKFGNSSLIYSLRKVINYTNQDLNINALIKNKENFKKGSYYINVFHKSQKVGSTKITLK